MGVGGYGVGTEPDCFAHGVHRFVEVQIGFFGPGISVKKPDTLHEAAQHRAIVGG